MTVNMTGAHNNLCSRAGGVKGVICRDKPGAPDGKDETIIRPERYS